MHTAKLAALLLVLVALVLGTASAQAETVNCTHITALPAVITVQGVYCFTSDLSTAMTTGNAIDIQTNNVILDLNGFKPGGLAAGNGTQTNGIFASGRQNITIKNGTIRGFLNGISIERNAGSVSQGHVVEDIRADHNTSMGISVFSGSTIVRNNQVVATGGTTVFGADVNAFGIIVDGTGLRVLNNDVINTVKQGVGTATGIYLVFVRGALVVNNRISVADRWIEYDVNTGSTGKYRDNITFDVTTPFTGGTNIGNNN